MIFLLGGITGVAYVKYKPVKFMGDYCLKIFLGFLLLMLILQLIRRIKIGNKVLAFLGSILYDVYLLHGIVFTIRVGVVRIDNSGAFVWSAVIITIIFAVIVKKISVPIIAVFKNIGSD